MKPARLDLELLEWAGFSKTLKWESTSGVPRDLTGYSALMQVREVPGSRVMLTLSSEAGQDGLITLGGALGTVTLSLPDTVVYDFKKGQYDLLLIPPEGSARRLVEGEVVVKPGITRRT